MNQTNSTYKLFYMATPAKSVQARDAESVIEMYRNMEIPAFGIRQGGALPFKYAGESMEEGEQKLKWFLDKLEESGSAAIYTLAIYEHPEKGINEGSKADASINFRLQENVMGYLPGEVYQGSIGAVLGELKELKKTVADLQLKKPAEPEGSLGVIGEIMELEPMQPILMAVGTRIADWLMGTGAKTGELKRVSGIPGLESAMSDSQPGRPWQQDPAVLSALDRLGPLVPDLGGLLTKLADLAEEKPGLFNLYANMLRKLK
jgi:hypothetical protein